MVRKVPAITAHFWAVKILTTAMGEALSDYLVHAIDPYIAVAIGGAGIVVFNGRDSWLTARFAPPTGR